MNTSHEARISTPFKVGDWSVIPSSGLLIKDREEVKLEPKVMEVLVFLAQNQGEVVSREALEANIWTGMVVGYDAVSGSIIKLRKALGDNSRNPRFIKTISKRGYQLIVPVSIESTGAPPTKLNKVTTNDSDKVTQINLKKVKQVASIIGIILIVGSLLYLTNFNSYLSSFEFFSKIPSVVVLPFRNLSDDPKQDYLSAGVTDDLITDLSRFSSLRVIARQSSYYYKSNPVSLDDVASQLKVLYIIEGSVRKLGDQIRINVQLINTSKHQSIWAQRFDTNTSKLFKVQDAITRNVMNAMLVSLSNGSSSPLEKRDTNNFEAYDAFLIGQQYIETRNKQGYEQAMNAYQEALKIDPNYARAYGALAVTLTRGYRYQWSDLSMVEARERALELANKAIALNKTTPQIYWALAYVHLHRREYDAAEIAAKQSVKLSPNYADGFALLANIANWRGKPNEAIHYIKKAIELNPHYTFQYPSTLGLAYYALGNYREAISILKDALDRNESALNPRLYLAATYTRLNKMEDASWEIEQINTDRPNLKLSTLKTILPFEDKGLLTALIKDLNQAGLH